MATLSHFQVAKSYISENLLNRPYQINVNLTDWFARKNVDDMVIIITIFITGTYQVRSITDHIVPLQSGSVFLLARQADRHAI